MPSSYELKQFLNNWTVPRSGGWLLGELVWELHTLDGDYLAYRLSRYSPKQRHDLLVRLLELSPDGDQQNIAKKIVHALLHPTNVDAHIFKIWDKEYQYAFNENVCDLEQYIRAWAHIASPHRLHIPVNLTYNMRQESYDQVKETVMSSKKDATSFHENAMEYCQINYQDAVEYYLPVALASNDMEYKRSVLTLVIEKSRHYSPATLALLAQTPDVHITDSMVDGFSRNVDVSAVLSLPDLEEFYEWPVSIRREMFSLAFAAYSAAHAS